MKFMRFLCFFMLLSLSGFVNASSITIKTNPDFTLDKGRVCLLNSLTQESFCFGSDYYFSLPNVINPAFSIDDSVLGSFTITAPSGLYIPYIIVPFPLYSGTIPTDFKIFYDSALTLDKAKAYSLLDKPVKSSIVSSVPSVSSVVVSCLVVTGSSGSYTTYSVYGSGFGVSKNKFFNSFSDSSSGLISWTDTQIDFKLKSLVFPFAVVSKTLGRSNFIYSITPSCS